MVKGYPSISALCVGRGTVFLNIKALDLGFLGNTHNHYKLNRGKHRCRKGKRKSTD